MFRNILANLCLGCLPVTGMFVFKRFFLNILGFNILKGAKICGGTKFYGRGSISIGADSWVGIGCTFISAPCASIIIGDRCDIAPGVMFHTGSHENGNGFRRAGQGYSLPISVGGGTWVGARVVVLGGVSVGTAAMLGANSTVTPGEYPSDSLIAGSPAVVKKTFSSL